MVLGYLAHRVITVCISQGYVTGQVNQNHPLHLSRDTEHTVCYYNQDKARAF